MATSGEDVRVFHIITDLDIGGAESMLKRLIESDPAAIPNTVVVSLTSIGAIGESLRGRGVSVHMLEMTFFGQFPITLWKLIRLIRHYRPTIVQTWMYHADFIGGVAAHLAGCRNVVWNIRCTSTVGKKPMGTSLVTKICALLSHYVPQKIICVAEAAKRAHIALGYDESRMVVISNGYDFTQFAVTKEQRETFRNSCHFSEGDFVVGCVGRFHQDKGHDIFVKAAAIVARSQPRIKFMLVGRNCDANNLKLIGWLNEESLLNRFVLLGERGDVPLCLAAMDLYCMPSRTEGFPNNLAEAMLMGLPCVATNVGDTEALVGDTAVLVPPNDEQALARGLLEVIALPNKQHHKMGQRANVRVATEFSIEKARERFKAVYREVLRESKK